METFKHLYVNACQELRISPNEKVISQVDTDEILKTIVDLSNLNLSKETCTALGHAFSKDVHITHLDFSDCMLPEEGLMEVLKGLETNKVLDTLILKGNNIKSTGALFLGKFLRHNTHLLRLNLEWNALGFLPDKFFVFAEGLAMNSTLEELDLKYNQLNYQCADSLANALVKNITLQSLALQFNNMGFLGGRTILESLFRNKTVISIDVTGNNVPIEIENGIKYNIAREFFKYMFQKIAILHNAEKKATQLRSKEEARALSIKIQDIENVKNTQLRSLLDTLDKTKTEMAHTQKSYSGKVHDLEQEIAKKNSDFDALTFQYQQLESALSTAEGRLKDLTSLMAQLEAENSRLLTQHQKVLSKERRERQGVEEEMLSETKTLKEKVWSLEHQVEGYKQKTVSQEASLQKYNATITKMESEAKALAFTFEEQLEILREKHAETLRENEALKQKEITRLKSEHGQTEEHYEQRIKNLQSQKLQLQEETGNLKASIASENLKHEEQMEQLKLNMMAKEDNLKIQLEEKMALLQAAKEKQEKMLQDQLQVMHEVQSKATALGYELEEQSHRAEQMKQHLSATKDESKLEVAKVKLEVKEKLEELDALKKEKEQWMTEMESMRRQTEEIKISHKKELNHKDEAVNDLKMELLNYEKKLQRILDEEAKRTTHLQMAFMSYLGDTKQASEFM